MMNVLPPMRDLHQGKDHSMTMSKVIAIILTLIILSMTGIGFAMAQTPEPSGITDDQVNEIARQLYCPVCENIPLDVCGTQACEQWRQLIRQKLSLGWSQAQIKQYFMEQYGDRVLGTPPTKGLNWLVYVLPPFAVLFGVFMLFRYVKYSQKPALEKELTGSENILPEDYKARIEEELKNR